MSIHVKVQVKLNLYTNRYGHRPWRSIDQGRAFFPLLASLAFLDAFVVWVLSHNSRRFSFFPFFSVVIS